MRRRQFAAGLDVLRFAQTAFAGSTFVQGKDWPARNLRIVCPLTPGGSQDNIAQRLAARLGEHPGQSFVIDNRTGAGGSDAADKVAKSPPDVVAGMHRGGFEPGASMPIPEVDACIKAEYTHRGEVICAAGIKPE